MLALQTHCHSRQCIVSGTLLGWRAEQLSSHVAYLSSENATGTCNTDAVPVPAPDWDA